MKGQATIHIDAPPERVYELVSDVTRMGQWSPECYRCEWVGGATGPAPGARFKGYNRRGRIRWTTTPRVLTAEPGREFSFVAMVFGGRVAGARWSYRFEPADGGTLVTESYDAPAICMMFFLRRSRGTELEAGMRLTLERVKLAAEAGT